MTHIKSCVKHLVKLMFFFNSFFSVTLTDVPYCQEQFFNLSLSEEVLSRMRSVKRFF